jgi:hypothetical protein
MTETAARDIAGWQYDPPYDLYNLVSSDGTVDIVFMTDPANGPCGCVCGPDFERFSDSRAALGRPENSLFW